MGGNLGLLGYTSFISYTYDLAGLDLSSQLACFYQGERPEFERAFQTKWALLLVGAIGGHTAVILAMYVLPETGEGKKTTFEWVKRVGEVFRTWVLTPVYAIYGRSMTRPCWECSGENMMLKLFRCLYGIVHAFGYAGSRQPLR